MVRTLRSLTDAGKEITGLPPGTIVEVQGKDSLWDYCFADGNDFWLGYVNNHFITLKRPSNDEQKVLERAHISRLIPHPDGPIILDSEGNVTQSGKPFSHRSGIPEFRSIPSITRGTTGLVVNSLNGGPCVNVTNFIPELTDYDHIEQHRRGLLISRGNSVWLVITEPVENQMVM